MNPAYLVGHITVEDTGKWAEYRQRVPETLAAWGGELVFRGSRAATRAGAHAHADMVVIRYPSVAAIAACLAGLSRARAAARAGGRCRAVVL